MNEEEEALKTISFALEVEGFLNSSLGKFLIEKATKDVEDALEKLKVIDPEDAKGVRSLQNRVAVAESIQYWLAEAIMEGKNAEEQLRQLG